MKQRKLANRLPEFQRIEGSAKGQCTNSFLADPAKAQTIRAASLRE